MKQGTEKQKSSPPIAEAVFLLVWILLAPPLMPIISHNLVGLAAIILNRLCMHFYSLSYRLISLTNLPEAITMQAVNYVYISYLILGALIGLEIIAIYKDKRNVADK